MQKVTSVTWDIYPRYFDNMDIMAENDKIATVQETLDLINNVKDGLNLPPKKAATIQNVLDLIDANVETPITAFNYPILIEQKNQNTVTIANLSTVDGSVGFNYNDYQYRIVTASRLGDIQSEYIGVVTNIKNIKSISHNFIWFTLYKESSSTSTISSRTFAQKKDYMNSSDILSGINYFQKIYIILY